MTDRTVIRAPRAALLLAAVTTLASVGTAFGQTVSRTWDGGGSNGLWSNAVNWNGDTNIAVDDRTKNYAFGTSATNRITTMDGAYALGLIWFNSTANTGYVVNGTSTMSLAAAGTGAVVQVTSTAGAPNTATINTPIALVGGGPNITGTEANRRTFNVETAGTLTLSNTVDGGVYDVRKIGAGTLILGAANTFNNRFEINAGTVRYGNVGSFGAATIANGSGNTVNVLSNIGTTTLASPISLLGQGAIYFTGENGSSVTLTGPITANTFNTTLVSTGIGAGTNTTLTVNGGITGAGGITKVGAGTLVLENANSFAGTTFVSSGVLRLTGSVAGPTSVGGGFLQGTGAMGGQLGVFDSDLTDALAGGVLSPGTDSTVGTLTGTSASFGTGGSYLFNIASPTSGDLLALSGGLTATATSANPFAINVTGTGFNDAVDQQYTLVDGTPAVVGFDPAKFTLDTSAFASSPTGTFNLGLSQDGTDLVLNFTAVPEPSSLALLGLGGLTLLRRRRA